MNFLLRTYHHLSTHRRLWLIGVVMASIGVGMISAHSASADVFSIAGIADDAVAGLIGYILRLVIFTVGTIFSIAASLFLFAAQYNTFIDHQAVRIGWTAVRDLSNMFFVLILLVIAFGTILRAQSYSYKNLLVKFILMALLINFSDTIAGVLIDLSQVVFLTFVNAFIADSINLLTFENALGLAQIFRLQIKSDYSDIESSGFAAFDVLAIGMLGVLFLMIATGVILGLAIMLLGRIVALWILLILSPIPYLASILPTTQKFASEWWSSLGKYLVNAPVLGFFLWLTFTIIAESASNAGEIVAFEGSIRGSANAANPQLIATQFGNVNSITNFVVVIALLIGGAKIASSVGGLGAEYAAKLSTGLPAGAAKLAGKAAGTFADWRAFKSLEKKGKAGVFGLVSPGMWKYRYDSWQKSREEHRKEQVKEGLIHAETEAQEMQRKNQNVRGLFRSFMAGDPKFWKEYIGRGRIWNIRNAAKKTEEAKFKADERKKEADRVEDSMELTEEEQKRREKERLAATARRPRMGTAAGAPGTGFNVTNFEDAQIAAQMIQSRIQQLLAQSADEKDDSKARILAEQARKYQERYKDLFKGLEKHEKAQGDFAAAKVEIKSLETQLEGSVSEFVKDALKAQIADLEAKALVFKQEQNDAQTAFNTYAGPNAAFDSAADRPEEQAFWQHEFKSQERTEQETIESADEYLNSAPGSPPKVFLTDDEVKAKKAEIKKLRDEYRELLREAGKTQFSRSTEALRGYYELESHEMSGLPKESMDSADVVSRFNAALADKNYARMTALLKKAAMDGNDNEVLNEFGYDSGPQATQRFRREILEKAGGMNEQFSQQIITDIGFINERIGHYNNSRMHSVDSKGLFYEVPHEVQAAIVANEMMKGESRNMWQRTNRLGLGFEDTRGKYHLDLAGKIYLAMNQSDFLYRLPRGEVNPNLTANFSNAIGDIRDLVRQGHVSQQIVTGIDRRMRGGGTRGDYGYRSLLRKSGIFGL